MGHIELARWPDRILIAPASADFLARLAHGFAGSPLGSVAYVAPEIVRGEEPTPASDRYSFAATVFHCLTGDVVFPRGSDAAVLYAHATEPPPSVGERTARAAGGARRGPRARPGEAARRAAADARGRSSGRFATPWGPVRRTLGSPQVVGPFEPDFGDVVLPPPVRARPDAGRRSRIGRDPGCGGRGVALAAAAALSARRRRATAAPSEVPLGGRAASRRRPGAGQRPGAAGALGRLPRRGAHARARRPCSIVQSELPGGDVLVPADGAIVGWTVHGAEGEIALDVIRPRGSDTVRVGAPSGSTRATPGRTASRPARGRGRRPGRPRAGPGRVDRGERDRGRDHAALARAAGRRVRQRPTRTRARGSTTRWPCGRSSSRASASRRQSTSPAPPPRTLPTAGCASGVPDRRRAARDHAAVWSWWRSTGGWCWTSSTGPAHAARVHPGPRARGGPVELKTFEYPGEPFGGGRRLVGEPELRPDDLPLLHRRRGETSNSRGRRPPWSREAWSARSGSSA